MIRRLCESPHRKLIVTIVTTLFGLLVLIPLVDEYFDNQESLSNLTGDLDRARSTAKSLPKIEKQFAELSEKLTQIESRSITGDSLSAYRNKVVGLVHSTNCRVKQFDVGTPVLRPWMSKDSALETKLQKNAKNKKTPFTLERRNVALLVDGPMESLKELLGKIHDDDSMAYLHHMELQGAARGKGDVTLKIELWLFALNRHKA